MAVPIDGPEHRACFEPGDGEPVIEGQNWAVTGSTERDADLASRTWAALACATPALPASAVWARRWRTSVNDWTPLDDVAAGIAATGIDFPAFWSFVACSLGESVFSGGAPVQGPAAFDVLSRYGAVSMVAMRSPIRVSMAKVFLSDYLARFVSGNAPELAAAGARHVVFNSDLGGANGPQDWAAPAVWSVAEPIVRVTWGADDTAARTSDMALRLLRKSSKEQSLGAASIRAQSFEKANTWCEKRRVRIDLPSGTAKGSPSECAVLLEAARRRIGVCPILIDVPDGGRPMPGV
jgi:hypothetical protein